MNRTLRRVLALLLLAVGVAVGITLALRGGAGGYADRSGTNAGRQLTLEQAQARFKEGVLFLDARSLERYVEGHIPGAHHFHAETILDQTETIMNHIAFGETVVIYCAGGNCEDSRQAYRDMQRIGYESLYIFEGGWEAWSRPEHALPIERGEPPYDYGTRQRATPDSRDASPAPN